MTIKQLLDCEEAYPGADLAIDGVGILQVTVVGQVRAVNPQATNITYRLDDGTGTLDVKKWVDVEKQEDAEPKFAPDQYVRVWGRLKTFNGRKHLGANFIRSIEDVNEVNYHMVEATYVHLFFTKGLPAGGNGGGGAGGGAGADAGGAGGGDSMFVDGYNGGGGTEAKVAKCSPSARKMWHSMMHSSPADEGHTIGQIMSDTNMSLRDVAAAAEELLNEGLIYTTVNDQTWSILEY